MGFKLFGRKEEAPRETVNDAQDVRNTVTEMPSLQDEGAWAEYLSGKAGFSVGVENAVRVAAVFRCVDLLSKTMASLPLHMYKRTDAGKEKAHDHPLYTMMLMLPNEYTTAYEFWQCFVANLLLTRGGYAKIKRDGAGRVQSMWNVPTANVSYHGVNSRTGERYITVTIDGVSENLYPGEYLYVPNFRFSSDIAPENPLNIAAEVIGASRDLNQYARSTFVQGINPGGMLEGQSGLSDEAYERLKTSFAEQYGGMLNHGKWILLEEGFTAKPFTRDLEKTQALESRKFAINEICRIFGVPPHLCFDLDHATFSNIEHQSLEFVRDAINPNSIRIEQALYRDALTPRERREYFWKFNTNGLMRGDTAARTAYYNTMRQNGIMNADEIRELEDMNQQPDGTGQVYLVNGNMISVEAAKQNMPKGARQDTGTTGTARR